MITLKNNTKSVSKIGYIVSIDPLDPTSFVYTTPNSTKAIGVITQAVPYRSLCKIATIGDKARVYVPANVNKDDVIRASKSGDNTSLGTCVKAKAGDSPYLKVGDALSSGKGLISVILELSYIGNASITGGIVIPTTFPYTVKTTDTLIVVDSAVAVTINLPSATGSSREIKISSIGLGEVTVEGNGTDEIDGELNQPINQWDTMNIIDYISENWIVV